jgi:chromatin remodeling complex protein RSC6
MKALQPSEALAKITGPKAMPRTEVTKALWAYIKEKGLQDQTNKRLVKADEALRPIFGKDVVSMFEMTALVSKHLS